MGKKVTRQRYDILFEELTFQKERGNISDEQMKMITAEYEILDKSYNFMRIILTIGAVLVALGILSFIASNWQAMGKIPKLLLIIVSYLGISMTSFKLEDSYPKLSESLLLIGAGIFGAGIFLIGQMFHFGGHFTSAFLLWTIGILPTVYLLKDRPMFILSIILGFFYINGYISLDSFPFTGLILLGTYYYLNKYFDNFSLELFFINLLALNLLAVYIGTTRAINVREYFGIIYFVVGLLMIYMPLKTNRFIVKLQGNLVFGLAGIYLTFDDAWKFLDIYNFSLAGTASIIFAILFTIYLLYLVKQENLIALAFICITIFRYYVDTLYDFMPKSLFFLSSGLILIGFGYFIERKRRQTGGMLNE